MTRNGAMFMSGLVFGLGLAVSGMTEPAKVVGFLDVTGAWDPSLAFVMVGALVVHWVLYRFIVRWPSPLLGGEFRIPSRKDIDRRLVTGAALFGVGWGLAGYCPGPGIVSLGSGAGASLLFVAAMLSGMLLFEAYDALARRRAPPAAEPLELRGVDA